MKTKNTDNSGKTSSNFIRRETGGGEGVEIIKNEPFVDNFELLEGKFTQGQYTYKIYHVETKVPKVVRWDTESL